MVSIQKIHCSVYLTAFLPNATVVEIEAQDWESLYEKNYTLYIDAFKESKRLEEIKSNKLQNYIFREQEYRQVISDLKHRIDTESQKPLKRIETKSEDQL